MTPISHQKARDYLHARVDGNLGRDEKVLLEDHLATCAACTAEAQSLAALEARLKRGFHARWDAHLTPKLAARIRTHARRINLTQQTQRTLRTAGSIAALALFTIAFTLVLSTWSQRPAILPDNDSLPDPQPGSRLIAFAAGPLYDMDIYTVRGDGTGLAKLTGASYDSSDRNPAWSPDGKQIAFASDRQEQGVYIMNADGSKLQLLAAPPVDKTNLTVGVIRWSPDGQNLLFNASGWDHNAQHLRDTLYTAAADGSTLTVVGSTPGFIPRYDWSPDGTQVLFVMADFEDSGRQQLYTAQSDGSQTAEITRTLTVNEIIDPRWAPDGRSIGFAALQKTIPPAGGNENESYTWTLYQSSPDGRTLVTEAAYHSPISAWWNGTVFLTGLPGNYSWTWARPNGKSATWNPYQRCENYQQGGVGSAFAQSPGGSLIIGIACLEQKTVWLYWVNTDGTEFLPLNETGLPASEAPAFAWSPDGRFATMTLQTGEGYELYLIDIARAKNNPSLAPTLLYTGSGPIESVTFQPLP